MMSLGPGRQHALVVGGTGMLAGTCLGLAERHWLVSVVGRDQAKLARLATKHRAIIPISIDYRDGAGFRAAIELAIERRGPIELAVCWIRSAEPRALEIVAELLSGSGRLVHVLGTAGMAAAVDVEPLRRRVGSRYTRVVLGGVSSGPGWRWLTHEEINIGVLEAIDRDVSHHVGFDHKRA